MRGQKGFSNLKENIVAVSGLSSNNRKMRMIPKLCWKCQKESRFEEGAYLNIKMGLHKYICKPCMDTKRAKVEIEEQRS